LFRDWLDLHFPERADKVMNIIRELRGGKDNDPAFFSRMRGTGTWAALIRTRVRIAKAKHALNSSKWNVRSDLFVPPADDRQLSLF
jgi:DNA repair photolyase